MVRAGHFMMICDGRFRGLLGQLSGDRELQGLCMNSVQYLGGGKNIRPLPERNGPLAVIRMTALLEALGVSRTSVYGFMDPDSSQYVPDFPLPIRLGHGERSAMGWRLDELTDWINSRPRTRT